jgi:O-antigen ligase
LIIVICWKREFCTSRKFLTKLINFWIVSQLLILILVLDSRGAFLGLSFAYFSSMLFGKYKNYNYLLIFLPILLPIFGIFFLFYGDESSSFSREGSTLFSHREYLWLAAISGIGDSTLMGAMFGHGSSGYVNFDFGETILYYFEDRGNNNFGSLHNAYLQLFYEFGLTGFLLFLSAYFWLVSKAANLNILHLISPLFSYLFFVASTEAILSLSYYFVVLGTFCFSLLIINKLALKIDFKL